MLTVLPLLLELLEEETRKALWLLEAGTVLPVLFLKLKHTVKMTLPKWTMLRLEE